MHPFFLSFAGVLIAAHRIDYIDLRSEGNATIHIGSNSVTSTDEADIAKLRALFLPETEADPVEVLREQTIEDAGKPGIQVEVPVPAAAVE